MQAIVSAHLKAEGLGDIDGTVAVYTDDIEHDAVGFRGSPRRGKAEAREFYQFSHLARVRVPLGVDQP
jgi:hypothetical protein